MILAFMNNKGGVAKTTTAVNLAAALAGRSYHVLLIDLDNQGGASASLGVARTDRSPSLADVLLDNVPLRKVIRPMSLTGLDLVTGSMTLANVDIVLGDVKGRERCLQQALIPVCSDYDFILLDCPPALSLLCGTPAGVPPPQGPSVLTRHSMGAAAGTVGAPAAHCRKTVRAGPSSASRRPRPARSSGPGWSPS